MIIIDLDDEDEKRHRLIFKPIQALKVTTADCFDPEILVKCNYRNRRYRSRIIEVIDSDWIRSLSETLKELYPNADFLSKSHHYIIDCRDSIYQVVAWKIEFQRV